MFKNATFLLFYFADNQLFTNSETLVINSGLKGAGAFYTLTNSITP